MTDDYNNEYEVGYGKPPKETRFKPGQSGNKKGRPKGSKNTLTCINEILNQKVAVTDEKGKVKKKTKRELLLTQIVNSGSKGNTKDGKDFVQYMILADMKQEEREKLIETVNQDDDEILEIYINTRKIIEEKKNGSNK